ncbi:hypothetical protein B5X24_HaOG205743, partial [Helicoverpa armigera]
SAGKLPEEKSKEQVVAAATEGKALIDLQRFSSWERLLRVTARVVTFAYLLLKKTPWVLGWLMCKTVPYVQGLSVAASVYSLVAVSLDR